jgi:hypothetical protein
MPTRARPLETGASIARQRPQLRQWTPRHTAPIAQPAAATTPPVGHPPSPRSDRAVHMPWTPRACAAFPLVHTCFPSQPHTSLQGIEATSPRDPCPTR